MRLHYHAYLKAAARDDSRACDQREYLSELQNALLWINYRYYLAPLFWFVVGGPWGPLTLVAYCTLRARQTGWRVIRRRVIAYSRGLTAFCT